MISKKKLMNKTYELSEGNYVVYVEIEEEKGIRMNESITLAVYSKYFCNITEANKNMIKMVSLFPESSDEEEENFKNE